MEWLILLSLGAFVGLMAGLFGIGGGTMNTPWLVWHGIRPPVAIATSSVLGVLIGLAGTATHLGSDLNASFTHSYPQARICAVDFRLGYCHAR